MLQTDLFDRLESGELVTRQGERIKTARQLARVIDYSEQHVSHVRHGRQPVTRRFLGALVQTFGPEAIDWVWEVPAPGEAAHAA